VLRELTLAALLLAQAVQLMVPVPVPAERVMPEVETT
jgi:hypothetical protein